MPRTPARKRWIALRPPHVAQRNSTLKLNAKRPAERPVFLFCRVSGTVVRAAGFQVSRRMPEART